MMLGRKSRTTWFSRRTSVTSPMTTVEFGRVRFEVVRNGIQAVFVALEQHQRLRIGIDDLPAQLRTDRAARAGHHHPLAL